MKSVVIYAAQYEGKRKTGERYLETFPFEMQPSVGDSLSVRIGGGDLEGQTVHGEVIQRRWELRAVRGDGAPAFEAILRVVIRI